MAAFLDVAQPGCLETRVNAIRTVRKDDDMHEAASLDSLFAARRGNPYLVVFLVGLMVGLTVIEKGRATRGNVSTTWRIGE